jgi:hypothetical protein
MYIEYIYIYIYIYIHICNTLLRIPRSSYYYEIKTSFIHSGLTHTCRPSTSTTIQLQFRKKKVFAPFLVENQLHVINHSLQITKLQKLKSTLNFTASCHSCKRISD